MPIAYTMILVGIIGTSLLSGPAIVFSQLKDLAYSQFSNYDLTVLPMFILMGGLASRCGLSYDLFRGANAWIGRFRGGIAMAAVAACGGFGAVCGSSTATASTMGQVALPELKRYGYSPALATGTLAAGGTLGILIPPSVVLIVYAIIVEANIVTLFAAALIPGLLAVLFFIVTVAIYVRAGPGRRPGGPAGSRARASGGDARRRPGARHLRRRHRRHLRRHLQPDPGGRDRRVPGRASTATACAGCRWRDTVEALLETARTTGMIFLILLGAELLKIFMARAGVPQATADDAAGQRPLADGDHGADHR